MIKWLLHITGRRESPCWSSNWARKGSRGFTNIIDNDGEAIRIERVERGKWRNIKTGEVHYEDGHLFRSTDWHFLDNKENWPDDVKEAYDEWTTV